MDDDQAATIVSRYKRYKAGTRQVVSWLAHTATKHCDLGDILHGLKDRSVSALTTTIPLKTNELIALAKVIVAAEHSTVPAGILKVLQDVIDGRQSCAVWYASQTTDGDTDLANQNESHLYFIGILQTIQQLLAGLEVEPGTELNQSKPAKDKRKKKKKSHKAASQTDELSNLFEYLEVEEPAEAPMGNTGPATAVGPVGVPSYELENDQDTGVFALWCHLKDMSDTRLFVRRLWSEYCQGDVTLEVVSTVTDAAISMIRRAHEEFVASYEQFDDWADVMDFFKLQTCFNNNALCVFPRGKNTLADHFTPNTKPTDLLCPSAALLLHAFQIAAVDFCRDCQVEYINSGHRIAGVYARTKVPPLKKPHTTTAFDSKLLSILPDMCLLAAGQQTSKVIGCTSFTDGLLPLIGPSPDCGQPMSAVFACQMCIDINELLNSDSGCGGDAVLQTASAITAMVERCFTVYGGHPNFHLAKPDYAELLQETSIAQEAIQHARMLENPQATLFMTEQDRLIHHRLKSQHPTLNALPHCAGTEVFSMKTFMFELSVSTANENCVMVLLAHFYKAACRYGLVTAVWHDLEFLIAQHSVNKPFMTKTHANATDPYAMLKHYLMDLGCQTSAFSHGTAPPLPKKHTLDNAKQIDMKASTLLSGLRSQHDNDLRVGVHRGDILDAVLSTMTTKSLPGTQASRSRHLSPTQLLTTLKALLIADEPKINFAYFDFTQMCLGLLSELMHVGQTRYRCTFAFEGIYYLMKDAAAAKAQGLSVSTTAFAQVASVMQSELQSMDTKIFSQAAFDASSGHIPKERRPNISKKPSTEPELDRLLEKYPGISVGSPRDTFEFYDPAGTLPKFEEILKDSLMGSFMPKGASPVTNFCTDNEAFESVSGGRQGGILFKL